MTISVTITIQSDALNNLTGLEQGILNSLSGEGASTVKVKVLETPATTVTPIKKEKSTPPPVQDELPDDDTGDADDGKATLDNAVKMATIMVAEGKAALVKEALATAGVKRVSELKGKAIAAFLEALNG